MKAWPWILGAIGAAGGAWWFLRRNEEAEGRMEYPEGVIPGVTPGYPVAPDTSELLVDTEGDHSRDYMTWGVTYDTDAKAAQQNAANAGSTTTTSNADSLGTGTSSTQGSTGVGDPIVVVDPIVGGGNGGGGGTSSTDTGGGVGEPVIDPVKAAEDEKALYDENYRKFYDQAFAAFKAGKVPMPCPGNTKGACAKAQLDAARDFAKLKSQEQQQKKVAETIGDGDYTLYYNQAMTAFKSGKLPPACPGNTKGVCAKAQVAAAQDFAKLVKQNQQAKQTAQSSAGTPIAAQATSSSASASLSSNSSSSSSMTMDMRARQEAELRKRAEEQKASLAKAEAAKKQQENKAKQEAAVKAAQAAKVAQVKAVQEAQVRAAQVAAAQRQALEAAAKKRAQQEAAAKALAAQIAMAAKAAQAAKILAAARAKTAPKGAPKAPLLGAKKTGLRGLATEAEYRAEAARSALEARRREWAANEMASRIAALTYEKF